MVFQSEIHYKHYLVEVERILKQDPHFRAKMKNSTIDDLMVRCARCLRSHPLLTCTLPLRVPALQAGKLTKELDFVHHNVRSKLDELKREEINRLRRLLKAKHAIAEEKGGVEQAAQLGVRTESRQSSISSAASTCQHRLPLSTRMSSPSS